QIDVGRFQASESGRAEVKLGYVHDFAPPLERHYVVEALGDFRDDGPVATAFDEPCAIQTTQRVGDRELLLFLLCAEGVAEVLLRERPLVVAVADQQRFEDSFVPMALALRGRTLGRLRDLVETYSRVRGGRQVIPAMDEPGYP